MSRAAVDRGGVFALLALCAAGFSVGCAGTRHAAPDAGGAGGAVDAAGNHTDAGSIFATYDVPPLSDVAIEVPPREVGGAPLGDAACAAHSQKAEQAPLDMYIILDSSGSMDGVTATGPTKWDAVRGALKSFLNDPRSAGIGVGLQYFPLPKPGVPSACGADAECGASGPCLFYSVCAKSGTVCASNANCARNDVCLPVGECSVSKDGCIPIGSTCPGGGTCTKLDGFCLGQDSCEGAAYATPAVEVAALPAAAGALVASLDAHLLSGATPTSAALGGAISHAQAIAKAKPGHRAVVLLATDGVPDECTPYDAKGIASIAASGLSSASSIATFVIGVFAPADTQAAHQTLDAIAAAGGTKQSLVISSGQDVGQAFLAALGSVRTSALSCEFKVPQASAGQSVDYYEVNVQFTSGAGKTVTIGNVHDKAACDARQGGWYYDVDPGAGTPQTISICDTSCAALQGDAAGRVDVLLGCKTEVIIP
jgi:hypothetical protein